MRDVLLNIVSRPSEEYFLSGTSQATDFEKLKKQCRAGWTSVSGRNRVWTMAYTAEKLALLLVLREQVDSENTSNRMHRNGLSAAAPAPAVTMVKRVMKRAGDTFFGEATSPATKVAAGKVCSHLARADVVYTSIVDDYEEEKNSQEIFKFCVEQTTLE